MALPNDATDTPGPFNRTWALFLVSVLSLFLELLLIRWIGTEIRIFAYLQNTVLVVCFLGLGMGCWTCRQPIMPRRLLLPLFLLVFILALPITHRGLSKISDLLSSFGGVVIWNGDFQGNFWSIAGNAIIGLGLTYFLMMLIWEIFVPLGRLMGRLLEEHPQTIWAYSVNVAGSLFGIWLFVGLSVLHAPPVIWFVIVAGMLLLFLVRPGPASRLDLGLLCAIVVCSWLANFSAGALKTIWSPYQKLVLTPAVDAVGGSGDYLVKVNDVSYQMMLDLSPERTARESERFPPEMRGYSQYDIPLLLHPNPKRCLIVGAGTGNDVAGALRHGAEEVVAVEIDPAIIELGRGLHPEQPYQSPKVKLVLDDARSFFETCAERFDVIVFGLLDSHTTTAMTNARLDHYVYTRESLQRARSLLADGGVMVLSFASTRPFITDRMGRSIQEVYDQEPYRFRVPQTRYGWGGAIFVAGDLTTARRLVQADSRLASLIAQWQKDDPLVLTGTTAIATDDWPYIYLESPSIPILYCFLAAMLLVLFYVGNKRLGTSIRMSWNRSNWHFFFLGAAFLLLEVQNISKASVVLGNTWWVNAIVISSILVLILLANWLVARFPTMPSTPVYLLLCGTCLGLYFVDISRFGSLPYATKAILVGGLTSLPMLFSGIVFIRSFAEVSEKHVALGANLLGALAGGLLQSITFVVGIKALLLIVAGLYAAAWFSKPRAVRASRFNSGWVATSQAKSPVPAHSAAPAT
jgi:spermidine synthase